MLLEADSFMKVKQYQQTDSLSQTVISNALLAGQAGQPFIGKAYFILANRARIKQENVRAITLADSALYWLPSANLRDRMHALNLKGVMLKNIADYPEATRAYLEAASIARQLNDNKSLGYMMANLGTLKAISHDFTEAVSYFQEAHAIATEQKDYYMLANLLNNMGGTYSDMGKSDSAIFYLQAAIELITKEKPNVSTSNSYYNLGLEHMNRKEWSLAKDYMEKALAQRKAEGDVRGMASSYLSLADLYVTAYQDGRRAATYLDSAMQGARTVQDPEVLRRAWKKQAAVYQLNGQFEQAFNALEIYIVLHDSIYNKEKEMSMANMTARFELERKDSENKTLMQLLQQEKELNKSRMLVLILAIIIVITLAVLLVVLAHRNKIRRQLNESLEDLVSQKTASLQAHEQRLLAQNTQLLKVNKEMDRFLYRISHDLRAPISSAMGLIELCRTETDQPALLNYLSLQQQSMKKLDAFIHDVMDFARNNQAEIIPAPIDFPTLLSPILASYQQEQESGEVRFEVSVPEQLTFISDSGRLALIFSNLIGNAVKYRYNLDRQPFVKITITPTEIGVEITVEDNGQGIRAQYMTQIFDMFYRANDRGGSGLGLYIAREAAERLGGTLTASSDYGIGSTFTLVLPTLALSDSKGQPPLMEGLSTFFYTPTGGSSAQ